MASHAYSRWLSTGAFSLMNRITVVFFGFLNLLFMVRMMPKSLIGIWVLFTSVTAILETIRNGGVQKLKNSTTVQRVVNTLRGKNLAKPKMDPEIRKWLTHDVYGDDIRNLQKQIGKDLTHWLR